MSGHPVAVGTYQLINLQLINLWSRRLHIELEQAVAGRQGHLLYLGGVPGRHQQAAAVGVFFYLFDDIGDLVDGAAVAIGPRAPLRTVDGTQVAVLVGPLVPDSHAVVLQIFHIGIARQEPQQLVDNRFQMKFLGRQAGESLVQIEPHLIAESTDGARSGAVALFVASFNNVRQHIEILFHRFAFF